MDRSEETRGVAIFAQSLAFSLISQLEAKAILTPDDTDRVFERVLSSLEMFAPDGDDVRAARLMADALAQILVSNRRPQQ
jgi:hypothetical protein